MEDGSLLRSLFALPEEAEEGMGDDDDQGFWTVEHMVEAITINGDDDSAPEGPASPPPPVRFHVTLAPDEGANSTLFAYNVWNGSRMLASYLHTHPTLVKDRTVLELGAACSLPSLVALHRGASRVTITDYPAPPVLEAITRTVCDPRNSEALGGQGLGGRVAVVGHLWGTDVTPLLSALSGGCKEGGGGYDVVIASECLWLHSQHRSLLTSISRCLSPGGRGSGVCLVSFAHHVPGCEEKDLGFFDLARREFGMQAHRIGSSTYPHMFNPSAVVTQHLYMMTRTTTTPVAS